MNVRYTAAIAVSALFTLVGCGGIAEKAAEVAIEQSTGGAVDLDAGDGSITITDEETGGQITGGVGASLPDSFPKEIPVPEGASLVSSQSVPGEGAAALWSWQNLTQEQFDAHMAEYEANGFVPERDPLVVDLGTATSVTVYFTGNGLAVTAIGVIAQDGNGSLTVQASNQ